jgi:hypothetical protein
MALYRPSLQTMRVLHLHFAQAGPKIATTLSNTIPLLFLGDCR